MAATPPPASPGGSATRALDIRTLNLDADDELVDYIRCVRTSFLMPTAPEHFNHEALEHTRWRYQLGSTWAAFDGGTVRGTTRTFPTSLRLPGGGTVTASALTQVTVLPTHTRRGLLTGLMRAQLEEAAQAGQPVSLLLAAEWPIYGRFGYGPATQAATWKVDLLRATVLDSPTGSIELVDATELRKIVEQVFAEHHARTPGAIDRDPAWWDVITGVSPRPGDEPKPARTRVVHRDADGRPDGYASYDPKEGEWEAFVADGTIRVDDLIAATPEAERELWRYVCGIDLAATLTVDHSVSLALPYWLTNGRMARMTARFDHVWVRLLDIPAAFAARRYPVAGSLVFDAVDPFLDRGGRFRLDVGDDGVATCSPTDDAPDVAGSVVAFGAAYLGGTRLADLEPAGLVEEHTSGSLERASTLLSWPVAPYCSTDF
ncbi:MAG: GNAT family N-acetyltransferase [Acidimicrobiales bacterium]